MPSKPQPSKHMLPDIRRKIGNKDLVKWFETGNKPWGLCRILIATGENASGKSLFRRLYLTAIKEYYPKIKEVMHISQQGRCQEGIVRAFVYGAEDWEATGVISLRTFKAGFDTSHGREHPHIIIWDEPEIGMSEETQMAAGQYVAKRCKDWPENLKGLIFTTHSRHFAAALKDLHGVGFLNLGNKYKTLEAWIDREIVPNDYETLMDHALERFRDFNERFEKK